MRSTLLATDESDDRRDDHGFVVVWLAIVLVLLLSIAAFAVDLVHAYSQAQRLQNAVDAAALAGATQIPADLNGDAAKERVREILKDNGFDPSKPENQLTLNEIDGNNPNQMNVEMKHRFGTMFANVMGLASLTVRRVASGQYDAKVAMGSPANNLGDVPFEPGPGGDSACADLNPVWSSGSGCAALPTNAKQNLFLQIQGRQTRKSAGGAYAADFCAGAPALPADGCVGGAGSGGNNLEYSADGQYYQVHNDVPGAPLVIAVYDAGFVHTGGGANGFCNGRPTKSAPVEDKYLPPPAPPWTPNPLWSDAQISNADPARYYKDSPYCAGDTMQQGTGSCAGPAVQVACALSLNTEFDVLAADDSPNDPTDNPVLSSGECGVGGAPWNVSGQAVPFADPDNVPPTPPTPISGTSTVSDGGTGTTAVQTRDFFQQYRILCTLPTTDTVNSDYIVRVRAPNGSGSNNFSILALHDTGTPPSGNINVYTKQRLPLFALMPNPGSGPPLTGKFYVARIQPAARDRQLDIDLFDLGDNITGSATGTIRITMEGASIPSSVPPNTFTNCSFTDPPGDSSWDSSAPWGPMTPTLPGCSVRYNRTIWNGQWVTLRVTIPGYNSGLGYTCNTGPTATPRDCWIKMEITPDAGSLSDATTWNASLGGAPVRLVK